MRKGLIILAIIAQVVVLAYMGAEREYIVRNGRTVHLRTAPIDPRDIFRGDYVALQYDISTIPVSKLRGGLADEENRKKGMKVYTFLKEGANGIAEVDFVTDRKPDHGLFIKGRLEENWRTSLTKQALSVKYGIEAYYVQQGKGKEMEKKRGSRSGVQIPLEMEIALGGSGTTVIRDYVWSRLGIGLEAVETPSTENIAGRKSAKFRLTLVNASSSPLAIVNKPDLCSFSLEAVKWALEKHELAKSPCEDHALTDKDVIVLQPVETRAFDFDFDDTRWYVLEDGKAVEAGALDNTEMFRLVYRAPSKEDSAQLKHKDIIWHGSLPSRAFHGRGNID